MESRTPRFDQAIRTYFETISAGIRSCPETKKTWDLPEAVLRVYQELRTPPSQLIPWAQIRRLRASVAGIDFFSRTQENGKSLITCYDPQSTVPLLAADEWNEARGQDAFLKRKQRLKTDRSFFEQWSEFSRSIPRPALTQDPKNENSAWTNCCFHSKNEYYCYNSYGAEDCLYCEYGLGYKHSCDLTGCDRLEWSYDSLLSSDCSSIFYCQRCTFSTHLFFCLSCTDCQDCFGCANLKNKKYYFLNQPLSAEEYKQRLAEIDLGDHRVVEAWRTRITQEIWGMAPRKAVTNRNSERAIGDELVDCRDVIGISLTGCERTYLSFGNVDTRDSCATTSTITSERCVYSQNIEKGYENRMSSFCVSCIDVEYSELLLHCQHCFGCIGLQHKQYCIFNSQYTEEAYWKTVDELKTSMLAWGEYGEFFPYSSFFNAYNTSNADIFFPLSEQEARRLGASWFDFHAHQAKEEQRSAARISELPFQLDETSNEFLHCSFRCEKSGRLYRIVKPELEWHREFHLALLRLHPTTRRKERALELYPVQFETTVCSSCRREIQTRIPLTRGYTLLCEYCYETRLLSS